MKKFIDRDEELAALEREYRRDEASLVVVYGRRRVGKTSCLVEFMSGKPSLYFLATEESEAQNRRAFKDAVAAFARDPLLASASFEQWDPIFERLAQQQQTEDRIVLVIDEFQNLGKANPAFPSIMQRIWDTFLSKRNVMVVLCGSLITMMVAQTLSYSSPLYGRRTAQLRMKQLPFAFYPQFFKPMPLRNLVERYSVTGGVPKYIELFNDDDDDIYKAIARNVLDRSSFLYDEPNFLLQKEVGEVGTYYSVIKAIAAGNRKLGNIAAVLEAKQTSLTKYLKALIDLDILERDVPATEGNPEKSKKGLYRIKDNFLLFWFRYVFPNLGLIESGHPDAVMRSIKESFVDGHVAYVYENVCRDQVWELAAQGTWPFVPERVGRWWGAGDVELDIVALSERERSITFGECKFWKAPVGANILRDLEEKAAKVGWHSQDRTASFALFSISGFTEELTELASVRPDVLLVGPDDFVLRTG
ncbi:ATP-binding protein [Arabiibacter massiliensis]|uniref:ATP-binding protein n=1 Tax=Arabiibacter massiliensis TaxID=1870985 RepID=UPI0009BA31E6|nr:ATP-binding protein [Arabiibacter massiliensis]